MAHVRGLRPSLLPFIAGALLTLALAPVATFSGGSS